MALVPDFQSDLTNHFFKGFKISSHFIDDKAKEIHFYLEPCSEFPVCPRCKGKNVVVHEYRKRIVQDDSIFGYKTVLFITYRTFKCKFCNKYSTEKIEFLSEVVHEYRKRIVQDDSIFGYKTVLFITYRTFKCKFCNKYSTEKIEFLSENSRFTTRVADSVNEDLERAGSIKDTAQRTGLSWSSCKRIHKRYLKKKIYFNLGQASHIAIDEFSIKKGHKYATVVVDLDTKRVIWVGKGKTVREVNRFFKLCGTEGCKQIKAVAMDQNAGFATWLI